MRLMSAMMLSVLASGCVGFCGGDSAEASLYVSDAEGNPVDDARFTEDAYDVSSSCGETDTNQKCIYNLLFISASKHTITVSAPGFQSQVVSIDATRNDSVHLAVALARLTKLQQIEAIVH